ncbi:hypothetical protein B484DRAFT_450026 [Ochromonadaceae sp. CCMP2298]|nr:hypothetical protein B484DRAFT_450026 [Ochromonadaceae sp. CCMP2298]
MTYAAITATGSSVEGRLLAVTAAVTITATEVTVPVVAGPLLLPNGDTCPPVLATSGQLSNTDNAQQNYETVDVEVSPGEQLIFSTCCGYDYEVNGDPWLRIFLHGDQVGSNDDTYDFDESSPALKSGYCNTLPYTYEGSRPTTIVMHMSCYESTSCNMRATVERTRLTGRGSGKPSQGRVVHSSRDRRNLRSQ